MFSVASKQCPLWGLKNSLNNFVTDCYYCHAYSVNYVIVKHFASFDPVWFFFFQCTKKGPFRVSVCAGRVVWGWWHLRRWHLGLLSGWGGEAGVTRKILGWKGVIEQILSRVTGSLLHHTIHLRAIIFLKTAWLSSLGVPSSKYVV